MDTLVLYDEVAALLANPPSLSPHPNFTNLRALYCLGWEFQFLVPISGTPIGSRILIPFLIPDIPVRIFLNSAVEKSSNRNSDFEIRNSKILLRRNSVHLILYQKTIAISFPAKITSTCSTCKTSRCNFGTQNNHATKLTSTQNE